MSNEEIEKTTSTTSEVVDTIDLTTIEPNILSSAPETEANEEVRGLKVELQSHFSAFWR